MESVVSFVRVDDSLFELKGVKWKMKTQNEEHLESSEKPAPVSE